MSNPFRLQREATCRRLGHARDAACLTREELAHNLTACTGIPVKASDVRRFEKSRVPWALLDEVARLTGTSRRWLLYGDEEAGAPDLLWEGSVFEGPPTQAVEQLPAHGGVLGIGRGRLLYGVLLGAALGLLLQLLTGMAVLGPLGLVLGLGIVLLRSKS